MNLHERAREGKRSNDIETRAIFPENSGKNGSRLAAQAVTRLVTRHFFAAAVESMRRILVENARTKRRIKHGGALDRQPLEDVPVESGVPVTDLLSLDEALAKLQ